MDISFVEFKKTAKKNVTKLRVFAQSVGCGGNGKLDSGRSIVSGKIWSRNQI
jgi:hypothetical protein